MAKGSRKHRLDPLSETQENSKWLLGYRTYTSWSEMSDAEWQQHWRRMLTPFRGELVIASIPLAAIMLIFISLVAEYGFRVGVIPVALMALPYGVYVF